MNTPPHLRSVLTASLLTAFAALPTVWAADSTWSQNSAGTFSTPGNWSAGVPGDASGSASSDVATFIRSTITASRLVTLDSSRNLAGITFDNDIATASIAYQVGGATFGGTSAGTLTLSPDAVIQNIGAGTATGGANEIDVAMVLTGDATVSNTFGNSVMRVGVSSGSSGNSITTAADLGEIDFILAGTSAGSSLFSMRINQASGTTVRMVKEGTGFWQINGPTATAGTMSGGLLIRQGGVSLGRTNLPIGSGPIVFGDAGTTAGDLFLQTGSGVTVNNNITVAASDATAVIIERTATGGDSIFQGTITLGRDLVLRQRTTGAARNLNIASNSVLTGTGNVVIDTTLASATGVVTLGGGSGAGTGRIDMTGKLINQSSTGTAGVNVTGKILSNVTEVVQNSATSTMTLFNAANTFNKTTVSLGTLSVTTGVLGTGDVNVANGATLTLGNNAGLQDTSTLFFGSTSTINLNFTGTDTVNMLASIGGSYAAPATYSAAQLNTLFGGSVFSGTGSLLVLSAVPEPSSFAALAGLVSIGFTATRRRNRR